MNSQSLAFENATLQSVWRSYDTAELKKLIKCSFENLTGHVVYELGQTDDGCSIAIIIGCLGIFGRKPDLFVAKEFKPGDGTYIKISTLTDYKPTLGDTELFKKLLHDAFQKMFSNEPPGKIVGLCLGKFS